MQNTHSKCSKNNPLHLVIGNTNNHIVLETAWVLGGCRSTPGLALPIHHTIGNFSFHTILLKDDLIIRYYY